MLDVLLASGPRLDEALAQQSLTDLVLAPALEALEQLMLELRAELDPALERARPERRGKPYPLGQCLEITAAVQQRLATLDPAQLSGVAAHGYATLRAFLAAGGVMRRAWGVLRDQYFQNALIIGALYVDVSNDTVVRTKPKVEILPIAEAGFVPIADYEHYARIAESYWGDRVAPNHLLPEVAPFLPVIHLSASGAVSFGSTARYMLGLTMANGFAPSSQALNAAPMPAGVFAALAATLKGLATPIAADPARGRAAALARCRHLSSSARCGPLLVQALKIGADANERLAALAASKKVA